MSAKRPRSSFAAPLVVTLAVAPACIVQPAPSQPRPTTQDGSGSGGGPSEPPVVMTNPPPPSTTPAQPPTTTTPPIRQDNPGGDTVTQAPPTTQQPERKLRDWNLVPQGDGKTCNAYIKVDCPPPTVATCNPPPPVQLECPANMQKTGVKIEEQAPDACYVVYPTPACPKNVACNPPRPQKIDCPTW